MSGMRSTRLSRIARALRSSLRLPDCGFRLRAEHAVLALALLLAASAAIWGAGKFRQQSPAGQPQPPAATSEARVPLEPAPVTELPSYAAVPRLTLPQALAEARPVPIRRPLPNASDRRRHDRSAARSGGPVIALVLDDMGHSMATVRRAAALPAPMTLAFLPYVQDAPQRVAVAREAGKEIFLHMPMEPVSPDFDPGPQAIRAGLSAAVIRANLVEALARVPGAVGVNNHMGSRATADAQAMRTVMELLRERGLIYVDSWTSPRSVAERAAREAGILSGGRDVFIDNERTPAAIRRQLMIAESLARRQGTAIVIGHPHAETLSTLEAWIPEARARGVRFAELSAVVRMRRCPEIRVAELCDIPEARAMAAREAGCPVGAGC